MKEKRNYWVYFLSIIIASIGYFLLFDVNLKIAIGVLLIITSHIIGEEVNRKIRI